VPIDRTPHFWWKGVLAQYNCGSWGFRAAFKRWRLGEWVEMIHLEVMDNWCDGLIISLYLTIWIAIGSWEFTVV
jgi:hypothetical protein